MAVQQEPKFHLAALHDSILAKVVRLCDEPTRDKLVSACKRFRDLIQRGRRRDALERSRESLRWTAEPLPTYFELRSRNCPKPNWSKIYSSLNQGGHLDGVQGPLASFYRSVQQRDAIREMWSDDEVAMKLMFSTPRRVVGGHYDSYLWYGDVEDQGRPCGAGVMKNDVGGSCWGLFGGNGPGHVIAERSSHGAAPAWSENATGNGLDNDYFFTSTPTGDITFGSWKNCHIDPLGAGYGVFDCEALGLLFEGTWLGGQVSGYGTKISPDVKYFGAWSNGKMHGLGVREENGGNFITAGFFDGGSPVGQVLVIPENGSSVLDRFLERHQGVLNPRDEIGRFQQDLKVCSDWLTAKKVEHSLGWSVRDTKNVVVGVNRSAAATGAVVGGIYYGCFPP